MGVLYVCGQRPGVGSTALCAALAVTWRKAGRPLALLKPMALGETGTADAELFASLVDGGQAHSPATISDAEPSQKTIDAAAGAVEALAKEADVLLVEGLPLTDAQGEPVAASARLAQRLNAQVLGVLAYDADLSAETAVPWREAFGDLLAGAIINRRTLYAEHDVQSRLAPLLREAGLPVLGVVPEERLLLAPTVRQVADHLNAQFYLWDSKDSQLIEHFLIGGLVLEWGVNYFNRLPNQAVIVKGTRPDIAMAALSCPLSCLILTGGGEPAQYMHRQADDEAVPLMVASQDTHATAQALESVHERVSVHHPDKVERYAELLADRLDWAAVETVAGLH